MKIKVGKLIAIAGSLLFCIALPAFGSQNATVDFTGIINTQSFGGGYADPYAGTVTYNGSTLNPNGEIICDDYYDEIFIPETWQATVTQASSLTSVDAAGDVKFGSTIGINGYAAIAGLVTDMLATNDRSTQDDLSAAIWWLSSGGTGAGTLASPYMLNGYALDPGATAYVAAALSAYGTLGTHTSAQNNAAQNALDADTNLVILTPVDGTQSQGGPPQEMWIITPEGGAAAMYLLLAGATCFGAMFFTSRNRMVRRETA
jgi:hypothetical protein